MIGMVFEGVIRDAAEIAAGSVSVLANSVSHLGPYKDGPGEIEDTISVGALIVCNGGVIAGDSNGITATPVEPL